MKTLTIEQIKEKMLVLARGQGFYSRLYNDLEEGNNWHLLENYCKENNIKNEIDLIMALEC